MPHDTPAPAPDFGHSHSHGGQPCGHDHGGHSHGGHDHGTHDHGAHDHGGHDGHDHGFSLSHSHAHHAPSNPGTAFALGIALNLVYVLAEGFYGVRSHSLALLADAGHNMSDVLALAASWIAVILGRRRPSQRYTYGLGSSSILVAVGNAMALLVATGAIAWEAVNRLSAPESTLPGTMMAVAAVGIVVNGGTALLFMAGSKHDLNVRGAFLHMAADALVTVGVVIAGLLIWKTGWNWLDPAVSLAIALVIILGTWGLLRDSVSLALNAVPPSIDAAAVRAFLSGLPGISDVHDLHIWALSTSETALTAHLVRPTPAADSAVPGTDALLALCCRTLNERFRIAHATIQIESGEGDPCVLAPDTVV